MNTFFRVAIYICILLIIFTVTINFVDGLNAFSYEETAGQDINATGDILSSVTGLADPNMNSLWLLVTGFGLAAGGLASWLTRSLTPLGIVVFSDVFWTSYIRAFSIVNIGGYIPGDFLLIFTIGITFLFIAAVIGMLTGSG